MMGWCVMKFKIHEIQLICTVLSKFMQMIHNVHVTWTCHTLGEAAHLSSDFKRICETYFPHTELAQIIARQHTGTPQAQHRVSMVKAAQ